MPKRLAATKADEEVLAYQAAYLRGDCGYNQQQVAELLQISQPAVSRLLKQARDLRYLQTSVEFNRASRGDDKAILDQLERKLKYSELEAALAALSTASHRHLRKLRVFDSGSSDDSYVGIERRQRTLGDAAARYVAERLRPARTIAVSWGSTLSRLIDGIRRLGFPWPRLDTAPGYRQIVPVAGDPVNFADNSYTSSTLARRLDAIVNGELPTREQGDAVGRPPARRPVPDDDPAVVRDRPASSARVPAGTSDGAAAAAQPSARRLALTGVPAFVPTEPARFVPVPAGMSEAAVAGILRAYVESSSLAYQRIFKDDGGKAPLISKVDVLLTGAGTDMGFCRGDLLKFGNLSEAELSALIVGDVGGVLLPRRWHRKSGDPDVNRLTAMWTGLTEDHLIDIHTRAGANDTAGVVVVCLGAGRVDVIYEILKRGLCTELVIDQALADSLQEKILGKGKASPARATSARRASPSRSAASAAPVARSTHR